MTKAVNGKILGEKTLELISKEPGASLGLTWVGDLSRRYIRLQVYATPAAAVHDPGWWLATNVYCRLERWLRGLKNALLLQSA